MTKKLPLINNHLAMLIGLTSPLVFAMVRATQVAIEIHKADQIWDHERSQLLILGGVVLTCLGIATAVRLAPRAVDRAPGLIWAFAVFAVLIGGLLVVYSQCYDIRY